jgi:hypothetical protein
MVGRDREAKGRDSPEGSYLDPKSLELELALAATAYSLSIVKQYWNICMQYRSKYDAIQRKFNASTK